MHRAGVFVELFEYFKCARSRCWSLAGVGLLRAAGGRLLSDELHLTLWAFPGCRGLDLGMHRARIDFDFLIARSGSITGERYYEKRNNEKGQNSHSGFSRSNSIDSIIDRS